MDYWLPLHESLHVDDGQTETDYGQGDHSLDSLQTPNHHQISRLSSTIQNLKTNTQTSNQSEKLKT